MRRADLSLYSVVGALAVFVAIQVARAPRRIARRAAPTRPSVVRQSDVASSATRTARGTRDAPSDPKAQPTPAPDVSDAVSRVAGAPPERDMADIEERIAAATDTYMPDMLVDLKHQLVRWSDSRQSGLRVWVQTITSIPDWDLRYAQMARDAVADWASPGVPIRFDFVVDSATADIRIVWIDRFPPNAGLRVGTTRRRNDQYGWLSEADIGVAVHDSAGTALRPGDLAGIVRHEAGHALGLGHSRDPKTKMYPIETVNGITAADRATLRLLYQLPPGVVP